MKKSRWIFLAKLVPLSILLFYIWIKWLMEPYASLVSAAVNKITLVFAPQMTNILLSKELYYDVPPLLALSLAMKTRFFSKLWRLELGIILIFLWHTLFLIIVNLLSYNVPEVNAQGRHFLFAFTYVINKAIPLVLWIALFRKEIVTLLIRPNGTKKLSGQSA